MSDAFPDHSHLTCWGSALSLELGGSTIWLVQLAKLSQRHPSIPVWPCLLSPKAGIKDRLPHAPPSEMGSTDPKSGHHNQVTVLYLLSHLSIPQFVFCCICLPQGITLKTLPHIYRVQAGFNHTPSRHSLMSARITDRPITVLQDQNTQTSRTSPPQALPCLCSRPLKTDFAAVLLPLSSASCWASHISKF